MVPKNILIVEDEVITAKYIKNVLLDMGVEKVISYGGSNNVLNIVKKVEFDLILMDINIEGKYDGIELAEELVLKQYKIPIIYVTAYSDSETLSRVYKTTPYGFIKKPFTQLDLETAVNIAYSRYKLENATNIVSDTHLITLSKDYTFDLSKYELKKRDSVVVLTQKQSELLHILVKNANSSVSYEQIINELWGDNRNNSSLRTLLYRLRKIAPELHIETHTKNGYILYLKS